MKTLIKILLFNFLLISAVLGQSPKLIDAYNKTMEYNAKGDYTKAIQWAEKALVIAEIEFGKEHETYAVFLNNLAEVYRSMARFEEAESLYKKASAILKATLGKMHPDYAKSLNNLAELCRSMARFEEAELLYKKAIVILKTTLGEVHHDYAICINNLALLYESMGCYKEAESLYKQALNIKETTLGKEHPEYAISLNNLADLYRSMGYYEKAESLCKQALNIKKMTLGEEHPSYATSLSNLADLYDSMGRYKEAEPLFKQSLNTRKKRLGEEHPEYAQSLNNLALFYFSMGRYEEAEFLYTQALSIKKKTLGKKHPSYASSLNNLALLYVSMGRNEEAESLYKQALSIKKKTLGKKHPSYATSLNNLALLYLSIERYEEAEPIYKKTIEIVKKTLGEGCSEYATSLNNLALLYESIDRYEEAEPLHKQALSIRKKTLGETHPSYVTSLNNLALLYVSMGRYKGAEPLFLKAISNQHRQIESYFVGMSEKEKSQFYYTVDQNFEGFNSYVYQRSFSNPAIHANAFNNQLAIKALLLNSTAKVKRRILNSGDTELIELYNNWKNQKEYLARIYTLSKAEIVQRGIKVDSLETLANDLEKQLSRRSNDFAAAADTTMYTWRDIQQALKPNEAAIEMVRFQWFNKSWTDTVYYAALIVSQHTKDYPEMVLLENGNDLEGEYYDEYLRCKEGIKTAIPYQQFWQPTQEKLTGIKKVYFSPDGIYNEMNLNILYNRETRKYLIDEIDIHLVTSTRDILAYGKRKSRNQQAVLFGRPRYDLTKEKHQLLAANYRGEQLSGDWRSDKERHFLAGISWLDLKGTEQEVMKIDRLLKDKGWQATVYLDTLALEEVVKKANNPQLLHIATHGFFMPTEERYRDDRWRFQLTNEERPAAYQTMPMLRSGLVLAGAETYLKAQDKPDYDDGILTAYEAANLDLDDTELVVLSACETGLGEVRSGEGVYGLQRAFKVAGARTILMSYWKVDDAVTQELMTLFYDGWLQHGDKRKAFQEAQAKIREEYREPKYWGAFVIVGE